ncbi:MAG: hypothetical protein AB1791_14150 [Chloroflexota bacterium]
MASNILDLLLDLSPEELELLRKVNQTGAASADELAIKLNRAGDDLTPDLQRLLAHKLLQARTVKAGGEETEIYLTVRDVRSLL